MAKKDSLTSYRKKRNFRRTHEPKGGRARKGKALRFVIQEHDATRLHYDFRLEAGGVLKSWAVPKGPSTDPREKRLAVRTEDHPLDYRDFEGVIPEEQYGAGTVLVWDRGTYRVLSDKDGKKVDPEMAIDKRGHIAFWLNGKKLKGGYALTCIRGHGEKAQWLLVKMDDEEADARRNPIKTERKSVLSGRTLKEIETEEA